MKQLTTEDMERLNMGKEKFTLIDVVAADEFDATRIPNARNIPLEGSNFADQVGKIVKNKGEKIVVYCVSEDCPASTNAARQLETAGFTNVFDYKEGSQGWDAAQIVESQI